MTLTALIHPPVHQEGVAYAGRYKIEFGGEVILPSCRDPEHELARALLARGLAGKVMVLDAITGRHRSTVDIEKAAKLTVEESWSFGPRIVKWYPFTETVRRALAPSPPAAEAEAAA